MRLRVLFYKSKWGDGHWIDNIISLWTRSEYSHVEMWLPDDMGFFFRVASQCVDLADTGHRGTCWTSTMRGDDNGTVSRDASGVIKDSKRWEYIEVEITGEDETNYLMNYMQRKVAHNKGYSKWDLMKFVSPVHFPDNDRQICSEFCNDALVLGGVVDGLGIVSPGQLFKKLTEKGYKKESLAII